MLRPWKMARVAQVFASFALLNLASAAIAAQSSPIPAGWIEIKPGGDTSCARGEEFSFFVHQGQSPNVLVDFLGGGACWNDLTCAKNTATFVDSVDAVRQEVEKGLHGMYDHSRADNPLAAWTHVVIPYCTGDIHWGLQDSEYLLPDGSPFTIRHRGAANVQAVLRWLSQAYPSPAKVLSTGCSAGSYGSIFWAPALRKMYPKTSLYQLGDSGVGVVTSEFFNTGLKRWNMVASAPAWIPELDPRQVDWRSLTLPELYRIVGKTYPDGQFSQFNTAFDAVQTFYYELMGGAPEDWASFMQQSIADIAVSSPNFRSFTAPGEEHCVLPYDHFYTLQHEGVLFKDWLEAFLAGARPDSVSCADCVLN